MDLLFPILWPALLKHYRADNSTYDSLFSISVLAVSVGSLNFFVVVCSNDMCAFRSFFRILFSFQFRD